MKLTPGHFTEVQFLFQWIYYYGSNKSTRKETGKAYLCAHVVSDNFRLWRCSVVSFCSFCHLAGILGLFLIKDFKRMPFRSYISIKAWNQRCKGWASSWKDKVPRFLVQSTNWLPPSCWNQRCRLADSGFFFWLLVSKWHEIYSFLGIWGP